MTVAPRSRAARTIVADLGTADRVERRRRLVEQDELRVAEQRDAEPESLLHALREAADRVVRAVREVRRARRRLGRGLATRAGRQARQLGVEVEDLAGPQPGLVAEELGEVADPPPDGAVAERRAEDRPGPRRRRGQPEQQLDGRRLARAVGPEEADELAAADGQVDAVEGDRASRSAWDVAELDHRL